MPSLQELVAFEAAGRLGSFSAAALSLSLTQGAISRQIASLESVLGVRLFHRAHRRINLTDAGRVYLIDVTHLLARLAEATERVAAFGAADVVSLAVLPTFATRWLIPRLPDFAQLAPDVTVNIHARSEPFDFDREPFDAAIHFGTNDWPGASGTLLCHELSVAVAAPELSERASAPAQVPQLPRLYLTSRLDAWDSWCRLQGLPPVGRTGARLDQFSMLVEAAAAGLGAAIVPRFIVQTDLSAGRLVELPGAPVADARAYWFMLPQDRAVPPHLRALRDWLVEKTAPARP